MPAPPLGPGDIYLHALANGALFLLESDGRSRLVTLDDAASIATGCHQAGCRILAACDDAPIAIAAMHRLRATGVSLVEIEAPSPQSWDEGTTALMEAAVHGNQRLLEDLLARGVPVDQRDDSGSSALHHAAAHGNVEAIDALLAAGATVDLVNHDGLTPRDLATATRQRAAAERLGDRGARAGGYVPGAIELRRAHRLAYFGQLAFPLLAFVVPTLIVWPPSFPTIVLPVLCLALFLSLGWLPAVFWCGGAPVRISGTAVTLVGLRGRRTVDLTRATVLALTRSSAPDTGRTKWLLIGHPDGGRVSRRVLRRLDLHGDERDAFAARADRVVVVPLDGGNWDEVVHPLGNVASTRGIEMTQRFTAHLAAARRRRWRDAADDAATSGTTDC